MSYTQLRRYKYILILMLIFLSTLFFNYVFIYAAFNVNNQGGLVTIDYVTEIDYTAAAINGKLKSVTNLTEIVFDYDDGSKYETVKSTGTPFISFAGQDHISSYAMAKTETSTAVYFLSENDIIAPTNCKQLFDNLSTVKIINLTNFNTTNTTSMSGMFSGCSSLTSLNLSNLNTSNVTSMYCMFSGCSSLTSMDVSNFSTSNVTNMYQMFGGCGALTSLDLTNLETNNVTSMGRMFYRCSSLTSLNLSNFNTSNVTSMTYMFYGCSGLTSLDLSNFNTSNVTSMTYMFYNCSSLRSLDVSSFDTGSATSMSKMFSHCSSLTSLDLSNFNTSNVTDMGYMLEVCSGLTSLDLSSFNTNKVTNMGSMFYDCSNLVTVYVGDGWNTDLVTTSTNMFRGCTNIIGSSGTTYNSACLDKTYACIDGGTYSPGYFSDISVLKTLKSYVGGLNKYFENSYSNYGYYIKNIIFDYYSAYPDFIDNFANYSVYNVDVNSSGSIKLYYVPLTTNTADCYILSDKEICANEDCSKLFYNMGKLESITFNNFNTDNVLKMERMFQYCSSIIELNLSTFNTGEVIYMDYMFSDCSKLESLDISSFDTSRMDAGYIGGIDYMFKNCSSLTNLDLSNFDTSGLFTMIEVFSGCSSLTSLDLSNFNTTNVRDINYIFSGCSSLISLDLSSFNTSNVTNISGMFNNCSNLISLNLTSFNTSAVTTTMYMFNACSKLKTIHVGSEWNMQNVQNSVDMFAGCASLVGENGTVYNSSYINKTYARIDNVNPGYLTGNTITLLSGEKFNQVIKGSTSHTTSDSTITKIIFGKTKDYKSQLYIYQEKSVDLDGGGLASMYKDGTTVYILSNLDMYFNEDCSYMFSNLTALSSIEFNNFNTSNVSNMSYMFNYCQALTSIDLLNFETSSVVDMSYMFNYCQALTSIDLLNFETSGVIDMSYMFNYCQALTSLDLSSFNVGSVETIGNMFSNCIALETIYVETSWVTDDNYGSLDSDKVFINCRKLVGEQGTSWTSRKTSGAYARIDGDGGEGYFTQK